MSPTRIAAVVLLVAIAGCTGFGPAGGDGTTAPTTEPTTVPTTAPTAEPTTSETTEPHTAVGTSHISTHLVVRASSGVENVTVTLSPGGGTSETYDVPAGDELDLTREIHDRGHDVRVVVDRGSERVFDEAVLGYEYYEVVVDENDTRVEHAVV